MEFDKVVEHLEKIIYKYIDDPTIEIEARLGVYDEDDKIFSSNIGDKRFEEIKKMLDSGTGEHWENPEKYVKQTDYFNDKYRLSVFEDGKQRCIQKNRIENVNFIVENGPFDIRVSISKEIPVDVDSFPIKDKCGNSRTKKRFTYKYKNMWNFDLTEIDEMIDGGNELAYEYEIELNNINKIKNAKYISESLMLKILDAVKMCDEDEEEYKIKII